MEKPMAEGLGLMVTYTLSDGSPADLENLVQGEDIEIKVTVENRSREELREVALTHLLPSGWEIYNDRLASGTGGDYGDLEYQDIRDDGVYSYFDLPYRGRKEIKITVNSSYTGRFYLPLITAGPMYVPDYQTILPGKWITVKERE